MYIFFHSLPYARHARLRRASLALLRTYVSFFHYYLFTSNYHMISLTIDIDSFYTIFNVPYLIVTYIPSTSLSHSYNISPKNHFANSHPLRKTCKYTFIVFLGHFIFGYFWGFCIYSFDSLKSLIICYNLSIFALCCIY